MRKLFIFALLVSATLAFADPSGSIPSGPWDAFDGQQVSYAYTHVAGTTYTFTHIQGCNSFSSGGSVSTWSCTFGSNITAGHIVVLSMTTYLAAATSPSVSGDSGTFHHELSGYAYGNGGGGYLDDWYTLSAGGGGTTLTVSPSSGQLSYPGLAGDEWSCSPSCSPAFDQSDSADIGTGTGTSMASNAVTPTANQELIIGVGAVCCGGGGVTITQGSGFTAGSASGFPLSNEWKKQTTAAAIQATFTSSSGTQGWAAHIFTINAI